MSTTKQKYLKLLPIAHGHGDRQLFFPMKSESMKTSFKVPKILVLIVAYLLFLVMGTLV